MFASADSFAQATRDWLLMEMGDAANVDDQTFADIAEAADLPDRCRPQVRRRLACTTRLRMKIPDSRTWNNLCFERKSLQDTW